MGSVIMQAIGLRKTFGDFVANDDINFEIESGKIYAFAGENGAGKSTLMKMIYGVYRIDGGHLLIDGREPEHYNPTVALEKGIGMVFQDFRLVPAFTALENVFLSLSSTQTGRVFHRAQLRQKMVEISDRYSLHVNPDEYIWRLDLGQRQHVEIVKVLMNKHTRILIFDEPTSVLAPNEIDSFLELLCTFRDNGFAIILITHKIHEIVRVADVVHILRKGRLVHTFDRAEGFSESSIIEEMIGTEEGRNNEELMSAQSVFRGKEARKEFGDPVFRVNNLELKDDYHRTIISSSSFQIASGMILGVAGVSGNGQRELTEALYGIRPLDGGSIVLNGVRIEKEPVASRLEMGVRMLSEDPVRDNLFPNYTVLQHMAICGFPYRKKGMAIDWDGLEKTIEECEDIRDLNVPPMDRRAEKLSGGNIQRMAFARAAIAHPKLLIACYPSRGLDIATVDAVHKTLLRLRDEGAAILFISEDMNELFQLSDALIVLSENQIHGPYQPEQFDPNYIGEIMLKGEANG